MGSKINQRTIGTILGYCSVFASLVTGIVTVTFLTQYLGQSEYGVYSLVASLIGYMSIMDFGMHSVTVRYVAVYRAKRDGEGQAKFLGLTFKIYIVIDILVCILGIILYQFIPIIFVESLTDSEILLTQKLFGVLLLNLLISLPGAVFEAVCVAYEKFVLTKSAQLLKLVLKFILLVCILVLGGRSYQLVWLDTVLNIVILCIEAIYAIFVLKIKVEFKKTNSKLMNDILKFTSFIFIAAISDQINWKVDSLILGVVKGSDAVAISAVGMQIVSVFRSIVAVIPGIYLPKVTTMATKSNNMEQLTDLMIYIGRIQFLIIGLIICGFIGIGQGFIKIWVGAEYMEAYYIFLILAVALIIPSTQSIGINILEAKNMHGFRAKVYLIISAVNIFLTIFLVQKYGVVGAAVATAISLCIGNGLIINWYYSKKVGLNIRRFFGQVYGKAIIALVLSIVISIIVVHMETKVLSDSIFRLLIQGLTIVIIYLGVMCLFKIPQTIIRSKRINYE